MRHADGVRHLHLAAAGGAAGHDVLGHPAGRVRSRTVDLARVLAAERAATVAAHAAVGVDDDLAAGEAGVAVGATDDELAGGVDVHVVAVVGELRRDDRTDDLLDEVGADDRVAVDAVLVLGADEHVRQADRLAVLVVDGDLGLAVGAQVRAARRPCAPRLRRSLRRCASQMGIGIRSGVSSQA